MKQLKPAVVLTVMSALAAPTLLASGVDEPVNTAVTINGKEYTATLLEKRDIGPGTTWRRIRVQGYPLNVNLVTMDITNPYNRVETFQGQDRLGSTESIVNAAKRLTTEGHTALAAANGNFWCVATQEPWSDLLIGTTYGGNVRNGKIITETNNASDMWCGTPLQTCVIGADAARLWIEPLVWRGYFSHPKTGYIDFQQVNKVVRDGEVGMYNSYYPAGKKFQPVDTEERSGKTHFNIVDGVSTEVLLTLASGEQWNIGGDMKAVVTEVRTDAGCGTLGNNDLALVGRGANREALARLAPGDTVTVNNGWTSFQTWETPRLENVMQGLALILNDGEIDPATNQGNSYNNQVYPKTVYGCDKTNTVLYIMTIDRSTDPVWGASAGCPSSVACDILKAYGCWRAAAVDAGGSTEMFVTDRIVNKTTESAPRAVANGWMVFSTAPTDNVITRLEFDDVSLKVPVYSSTAPRILGYNQYGALVDDNVAGIVYDCDATVGTCSDGLFHASATAATGTLTARLGDVSVSKAVAVTDADIAIRLHDIVADKAHPYTMEVKAYVETTGYGNVREFDYNPAAMTWTTDDASTAYVDETGALMAAANGTTVVSGSLGNVTDRANIHVQIPRAEQMAVNPECDWKTSATSVKNIVVTPVAGGGHHLAYTVSSSRGSKITLAKDTALFGLPDLVRLTVNPGTTAKIKSVILTVQGANQSRSVAMTLTPTLEPGVDNVVDFRLSDLDDSADLTADRGFFPVTFKSIAYNFDNNTGNYAFDVPSLDAVYSGVEAVNDIVADSDSADGPAVWYTIQGVRVDSRSAAPGIYIVRRGSRATKVLVK